jgi:hypothetical protein
MTFGGADWLASKLPGVDLAQERAKTQAARAAVGPVASFAADLAGYGMGPGKLLGPLAASAGWAAPVAEGAAAGALGGFGHGGDAGNVAIDAITGGAFGGTAGLASRALAPLARKIMPGATPADVTAAAKAARGQAYDALKDVFYKPGNVDAAIAAARNDIKLADLAWELRAGAPRSMAALNSLSARVGDPQYPAQTAHSVYTTVQNLDDYTGQGAGAENDIATLIRRRLNDFLANATPVSATPTSAAALIKQANDAHKTYANAAALQQ